MKINWGSVEERRKYHREYQRVWRGKNKIKLKEIATKYRLGNIEKIRERDKIAHRERRRLGLESAAARIRYKDPIYRAKKLQRWKDNYNNNLNFRVAQNVRCRLRIAMKGVGCEGSTLTLIGCSVEELRKHLELRFSSGMSWDNYGYSGWHIDHIKPLFLYDLSIKEQLVEACHYTNLQPLWAAENMRKNRRG